MVKHSPGVRARLLSLIARHGRRIMMVILGVPAIGALFTGALVPGPVDYGILTGFVVRRCGLLRTTVAVMLLFVLASAAIPHGCGSREKAYTAAMKSDLRNLASQQEIHYSEHYTYSPSPSELAFVHSDGVTVTIVAGGSWWAATATHAALAAGTGCAVYYGYGDDARARSVLESLAPVLVGGPGEVVCSD